MLLYLEGILCGRILKVLHRLLPCTKSIPSYCARFISSGQLRINLLGDFEIRYDGYRYSAPWESVLKSGFGVSIRSCCFMHDDIIRGCIQGMQSYNPTEASPPNTREQEGPEQEHIPYSIISSLSVSLLLYSCHKEETWKSDCSHYHF